MHDHLSVDRPSAVLQHSLLLTLSADPLGSQSLPWEALVAYLFSPRAQLRTDLGAELTAEWTQFVR
jgi:hypothetical protein